MKQSYSVKSGGTLSQANAALSARGQSHMSLMQTSPSSGLLFSRQGILQRKPKANVVNKNITHIVRIALSQQYFRRRSSRTSSTRSSQRHRR